MEIQQHRQAMSDTEDNRAHKSSGICTHAWSQANPTDPKIRRRGSYWRQQGNPKPCALEASLPPARGNWNQMSVFIHPFIYSVAEAKRVKEKVPEVDEGAAD